MELPPLNSQLIAERPRRSPSPRRRLPEAVLHTAWRSARVVEGRKGDRYKILYAGIPGGSSGPDFQNAVIETPTGDLIRGDVEIHLSRSGWFEHGHHRDPAYNGVVFHVTADQVVGDAVPSASGLMIPLLLLKSRGRNGGSPGTIKVPNLPDISLAEAGDRRFFARSSGLELMLDTLSSDELLWLEILECAGYSANRKAFRDLAKLVPWSAIRELGRQTTHESIEKILLGAGGFIERSDLAGIRFPDISGRRPQWSSHPGRPDNRPQRRIAGIARLAQRWLLNGGPSSSLQEAVVGAQKPIDVVAGLTVADLHGNRAFIGEGRAREISVNAVLPAVHAIARREGRWHLYERSLALFRDHPKTPENSVTKEMRRLLIQRGHDEAIRGAREQQGLIYLYRAMTNPAIA